jgi:O-Antigen ligase
MVATVRPARLEYAPALSGWLGVGALAFAVFGIWAAKDAGYATTTWYPGALFLFGLVAVVALAAPGRLASVPRAAAVAIAFFVAYATWSAASIAWSSEKGIAWDGANRTFLYAGIYALFVLLRLRRADAVVLLIGFGVAVAGIGVVEIARAAYGHHPSQFFLNGRLAAPAGYPNAACALFVIAAWPVLHAAGRREVAPPLRGLLLAVVCVLAQLAVLTQSRASIVAVPAAVVVYIALVPFRLRALLSLGVIAVVLALTYGRLTSPYEPLTHGTSPTSALHHVIWTIALTFAVISAAWSAFALIDGRIEIGARTLRLVRTTVVAVVAVAALVGMSAVLAGSPVRRIDHAWHEFKSGYPDATKSSTHFSSGLGNNRYDFWRVAIDSFLRHPLNGVGADNFAEQYVAARRSHEEPLYPHSFELRVLAQTGLVGALLMAGFLVAAAVAARRSFAAHGVGDGVVRAGVAATAYWLIHGSVDWFWEFPALTAPALAALALAAGGGRTVETVVGRRRQQLVGLCTAVVAVAAAVACVFPWLGDRLEQRAAASWRSDPASAFRDLSRARRLNPLSPDPDLLAGAVASRLGDLAGMRRSFTDALDRDPRQWYARLELALADAGQGRRTSAIAELREARRLNPREEVVQSVERRLREGRPVSRAAVDRVFLERYRRRVGG